MIFLLLGKEELISCSSSTLDKNRFEVDVTIVFSTQSINTSTTNEHILVALSIG